MTDHLERSLREALSHQDAQLDPDSIARLRAVDYHPRRHRIRRLPTVGAFGTVGTAAVIAIVVSLTSGAAPAFAGWQATPSKAAAGQAPPAIQNCGQGLGSPALTDSRGPYTAAIYADTNTTDVCLTGNDVSMASSATTTDPVSVSAGQIDFAGGATRDSAGNQLTLADGRTGAGVTAVTFDLSDGTSVQATVEGGWYMAWWPGTATASKAEITTASGTSSTAVPAQPSMQQCPSGASCSAGYSSGGGASGSASGQTTIRSGSSSSASSSK